MSLWSCSYVSLLTLTQESGMYCRQWMLLQCSRQFTSHCFIHPIMAYRDFFSPPNLLSWWWKAAPYNVSNLNNHLLFSLRNVSAILSMGMLPSSPLPILNKPVQQLSCTNSASSESSIHFCFVPSLCFCTPRFPPFPPTQHLLSCDLSYPHKFINVKLAPCHHQNLTFRNMRSRV